MILSSALGTGVGEARFTLSLQLSPGDSDSHRAMHHKPPKTGTETEGARWAPTLPAMVWGSLLEEPTFGQGLEG